MPVLVKTSYFPNWEASGASGPYRVAPNFMVVVPEDTHVELTYGRTGVEYVSYFLTLLGIVGVVLLWRRPPFRFTPEPERRRVPVERARPPARPLRPRRSRPRGRSRPAAVAGRRRTGGPGLSGRLRRLAILALVPTLVDIGLLVLFRQRFGWILVLADLAAILVASVLSYALHRMVTFRSDPYVRWVEVPPAFVGVALVAAAVDVIVLRALFAGTGFSSTTALVEAKLVALVAAGAVRLVGYRWVLLGELTAARMVRWTAPAGAGDAAPERGGARLPRGRPHRRHRAPAPRGPGRVDEDGGWRSWWSTTGPTTPRPTPPSPPAPTRSSCSRATGARARRCGPGVLAARGRTVAFTDADLAYAPRPGAAGARRHRGRLGRRHRRPGPPRVRARWCRRRGCGRWAAGPSTGWATPCCWAATATPSAGSRRSGPTSAGSCSAHPRRRLRLRHRGAPPRRALTSCPSSRSRSRSPTRPARPSTPPGTPAGLVATCSASATGRPPAPTRPRATSPRSWAMSSRRRADPLAPPDGRSASLRRHIDAEGRQLAKMRA